MRKTKIVTAKMQEKYYRLIIDGRKRCEIRDESLEGIQAIRYISAEDGHELGIYRTGRIISMDRGHDKELIAMAGIRPSDFYTLFPEESGGGPSRLWAAELLGKTPLETLVGEG